MRPKVKISKSISYRPKNIEGVPKPQYFFKVINLSFFTAYDIDVQLDKITNYPVKNGTNKRIQSLKLTKNKLSSVAAYRFQWLNEHYGDYAMLFGTDENIQEILNDQLIEISLQITLKHGVTGLSKVYIEKFPLASCIKEGEFIFGKNLDIY